MDERDALQQRYQRAMLAGLPFSALWLLAMMLPFFGVLWDWLPLALLVGFVGAMACLTVAARAMKRIRALA